MQHLLNDAVNICDQAPWNLPALQWIPRQHRPSPSSDRPCWLRQVGLRSATCSWGCWDGKGADVRLEKSPLLVGCSSLFSIFFKRETTKRHWTSLSMRLLTYRGLQSITPSRLIFLMSFFPVATCRGNMLSCRQKNRRVTFLTLSTPCGVESPNKIVFIIIYLCCLLFSFSFFLIAFLCAFTSLLREEERARQQFFYSIE